MSSIYTEKWVLFLDILGFGDIINNKKKSEMLAEKILLVINKATKIPSISKIPMCISQFSDTFIVTIDGISSAAICVTACFLQFILLQSELLSRGAITYGKVFHNGSQFIGPAINRAYNLEKSEAIYPRVIIDPECEEKFDLKDNFYIKKDFDGYWYIDLIRGAELTMDNDNIPLNKMRDILHSFFGQIDGLYEKHKNTKYRGKYTWLKNKADEFHAEKTKHLNQKK